MTRDPSQDTQSEMTLAQLGWQNFFAQQTDVDEMERTPPVRVTEVHRNGLRVRGETVDVLIPPGPEATVGDWLLYDSELPSASTVLDRKSLVKRRAAGHDRSAQLIAANLDTAFIVTSCNQDFNVARLERYIALTLEAGVTPVIVLTKADLCEDPASFVKTASAISELVAVVTLDARGGEPMEKLAPWCKAGQTVAFLGSSGVGKSTLTNALSSTLKIETQAIREDDAKGRHTTTRRQLHFVPNGCAVLDTPGMRELQLTEAASGVADLFSDIHALTQQCKFRDCAHETEPGCAVRGALENGEIEAPRLERWRKLFDEDQLNTAALEQRRASDKALAKVIRQAKKQKNQRK
ncbi:ribosome small subunit-dependent GTPase A [Neptunicoccus sediminis]|uniref:ribosome small subunit-dependent GTPase A n=1 Tax=Neptunicoccus sediminis TaxID=1892596 RepID=UPI000845C63D|nr:ribosome small subunit-dependent GTPase A [Neptunicoccus sediminis]